MKPHLRTSPSWWPQAQQQGLVAGPALPPEGPSSWIIAVALLGALVCTIPLLALIGIVFSDALDENGLSIIGLLLVAAAAAILRKPFPLFVTCMGLVLWCVGCPLVVSKIVIDGKGDILSLLIASSTFLLLQLAGVAITRIAWVQCLMGLAAGGALFAAMLCASTWWPQLYMLQVPHLLIFIAWTTWVVTERQRLQQAGPHSRTSTWALVADAMVLGVLSTALYLGSLEIFLGLVLSSFSEKFAVNYDLLLQQRAMLACLTTACSSLWLAWHWRSYRSSAPSVLWLLLLAGALLTIGTWFSPRLALIAVIAAGALATARWRIAVLCGLLALGLLNLFYYTLDWSLIHKGLGLMALGAVLLFGLLLLRRCTQQRLPIAAPISTPPPARRDWLPLIGIVSGAVIVFAAINWDVRGKEQVITHGERILVPLVPVDPRSLMQGDYMTLRFALPSELQEDLKKQTGATAHVIAQLDSQGIAAVQRLAQAGESAAAGQVILPLKRLKGEWTLVTDAYFFPEGQGAFFEAARFGDFRVLPDGRALLVGLADVAGLVMPPPPALEGAENTNTSDINAPPALDPDAETEVNERIAD